MASIPEPCSLYRIGQRAEVRRTQGYQVVRWPKMCKQCGTRNWLWVPQQKRCFACSIRNR